MRHPVLRARSPVGVPPRLRPAIVAVQATLVVFAILTAAPRVSAQTDDPAPASKPTAAQDANEKSVADEKDPARRLFLQTNYVFNRDLWDLAIPQYEKLLAEHPDFEDIALVRYALALCHQNLAAGRAADTDDAGAPPPLEIREKHLRAAVDHLKEAIRDRGFPQRAEATRLLGQALLELGDTANAVKAFRWVKEKGGDPEARVSATLGLGEALYLRGRHREAAEVLTTAADDPAATPAARERARFYLAMSLYRAGEVDERTRALALFEAARTASANPHRRDAEYMTALILAEDGHPEDAVPLFRKLADAEPDGLTDYREIALHGLASAQLRIGRPRDAAETLEQLLARYPSSDRREYTLLLLGRAHLANGEEARALVILEELRSSATVGDQASLLLARELQQAGSGERAVQVAEAALAKYSGSSVRAELELELALALLTSQRHEDAAASFARIGAQRPDAPNADHVAYLHAYSLHRAGQPTPSRAACREFRRRHAGSEYLLEVVRLEAENGILVGDYEAAGRAYNEYLEKGGEALDPADAERARLRMAQSLYQDQKYREALELLAQIGAPAHAGGSIALAYRFWLGDCHYQLGEDGRAAEELVEFVSQTRKAGEEAKELASQLDDARFKLAHALQRSGSTAAARSAYGSALKANPATPYRERILFELGQVAYADASVSLAAKSFRLLLRDFPATRFAPHALLYLGAIDFEAGEFARAATSLQQIVDEHPESDVAGDAMYRLAIALRSAGDDAAAREILVRLEKEHPGDSRLGTVLLEEAATLTRAGKPELALERLTKLSEQDSLAAHAPRIHYEMAWCYRALDRPDAAARAYRESLDSLTALRAKATAPSEPGAEPPDATSVPPGFAATVSLELAELEFDRQEYAAARDLLDKLSAGAETPDENVLYRLCWSHHKLGASAATIATFERFEASYPKSELWPELAFIAAKTLLAADEIGRAGALFERVARDFPDRDEAPLALVSFGECQVGAHRWKEARATFEACLRQYPASDVTPRAKFGLGWTSENLGQPAAAIPHYREVVEATSTATAARAQFQIGQCEVAAKEYRRAIVEFLKVPATYDYAEWSARALLQVAGCFEALGDARNAARYYREVASDHAGRDEAKLATERLEKLGVAAPKTASKSPGTSS